MTHVNTYLLSNCKNKKGKVEVFLKNKFALLYDNFIGRGLDEISHLRVLLLFFCLKGSSVQGIGSALCDLSKEVKDGSPIGHRYFSR